MTAIPELVSRLDITGCVVTVDALNTQTHEAYGLHRLQKRVDIGANLPLISSLATLLRSREIDNHVLVCVVDDDLATRLKAEIVAILGDLTLPGNGFILSLDIVNMLGLQTE